MLRQIQKLAAGALCTLTAFAGGLPARGDVVRTFVYHEITQLPASPNYGSGQAPVLSANGNRAVFAVALGTGDPANPNRIYVVNADGTGLREVDAYKTLCFCGSQVDISADGSRVISTDAVQLRIANADGGGGRTLLALSSNEFWAIRISGDGSKVFFALRRGAGLADGTPLPAGVYVINADGSGLRQIVGTRQIAAVLGLPEEQVPFGASHTNSLDVSHDGSRIAFQSYIQPESGGWGQGVFAVNLDGSGLVSLTGRQGFAAVAISADGATVAYNIQRLDASYEVGVVPAGGTARRLAHQPYNAPAVFSTGFPSVFEDRLMLSRDGSKLLLGSPGVLLDTATGAALQLAVRGSGFSTDPWPILYDGLFRATMDAGASRFLYLARDEKGVLQLAMLDLNPSTLGDAPAITDVKVSPEFVQTEGRSTATVSARVTTSQKLVRVSAVALANGLFDRNVSSPVILDEGTGGDATANDGVFTSNGLYANCCAVVGPHTVRVKAEVIAADGRRHATAVEIGPFEVRQ